VLGSFKIDVAINSEINMELHHSILAMIGIVKISVSDTTVITSVKTADLFPALRLTLSLTDIPGAIGPCLNET
jgi:hypothetical protein